MKRATTDAVEIISRRFFRGRRKVLDRLYEKEAANLRIAHQLYDLRTKAGLSQRALAKLVGTTASVICRLEDADYRGHSLVMLQRIAKALNKRVDVRFLPARCKVGAA